MLDTAKLSCASTYLMGSALRSWLLTFYNGLRKLRILTDSAHARVSEARRSISTFTQKILNTLRDINRVAEVDCVVGRRSRVLRNDSGVGFWPPGVERSYGTRLQECRQHTGANRLCRFE